MSVAPGTVGVALSFRALIALWYAENNALQDRCGHSERRGEMLVLPPSRFWLCDACRDAYSWAINRPESPELRRLREEVERANEAYDKARQKEFPSAEEWAKLNPVAKSGGSS